MNTINLHIAVNAILIILIFNPVLFVLGLFGISPAQAIAFLYSIAMGIVSVPIVNYLKPKIALIPLIPKDAEQKIEGHIVPIVSTAIGFIFILLGNWAFGLNIFGSGDQSMFQALLTALGINVTAGQWFYEWRKSKATPPKTNP
jgi:hypothetical protein